MSIKKSTYTVAIATVLLALCVYWSMGGFAPKSAAVHDEYLSNLEDLNSANEFIEAMNLEAMRLEKKFAWPRKDFSVKVADDFF